MRSEDEIMSLILNVAKSDDRIRVVILNGSRANPDAKKDILQDFDILYMVNEMETFLKGHTWIDIFGKRLILQMPAQMIINAEDYLNKKNITFSYLMLFEDSNRIDLTLFPVEKIATEYIAENQSLLLLDKDDLFPNFPPSAPYSYIIKKPSEKEFSDCCNEFWWVSTYVAKGLYRNEITYAKDLFENPVRNMFMKMIEWHIGVQTQFTVSFGKSGKNIKDNVPPGLWNKILNTYPNADPENIWDSLFLMTDIFRGLATAIAKDLRFKYNFREDENASRYLKDVRTLTK